MMLVIAKHFPPSYKLAPKTIIYCCVPNDGLPIYFLIGTTIRDLLTETQQYTACFMRPAFPFHTLTDHSLSSIRVLLSKT